jgi:hemerythrin-like domain-containing protein
MVIERLSREHRNIEKLLDLLERELESIDSDERPNYEVIHDIIGYFKFYTKIYHHPQEDLVFTTLKIRDPTAATKVGDLAREHEEGDKRLRRVAQTVKSLLLDREISRQYVNTTIRDFIEHERQHVIMEERVFFPAALKALEPQDWTEIASASTGLGDRLFSDVAEQRFDLLRAHILRLGQEAAPRC